MTDAQTAQMKVPHGSLTEITKDPIKALKTLCAKPSPEKLERKPKKQLIKVKLRQAKTLKNKLVSWDSISQAPS